MSRKYILLSTFERKTAFSAIYKPKSAGNRPFFSFFVYFFGRHGTYLTPSNTTPCSGTPPANSQHTKQFSSRPHGL